VDKHETSSSCSCTSDLFEWMWIRNAPMVGSGGNRHVNPFLFLSSRTLCITFSVGPRATALSVGLPYNLYCLGVEFQEMRVVLCQEVTVIDIFFVLSQVRCVFYTPLRRYTNQTCMAIFESTYGVSKITFELLCFSCARVYLGRLFRQRQRVLKNSKHYIIVLSADLCSPTVGVCNLHANSLLPCL
jgi:hypothetical protein